MLVYLVDCLSLYGRLCCLPLLVIYTIYTFYTAIIISAWGQASSVLDRIDKIDRI